MNSANTIAAPRLRKRQTVRFDPQTFTAWLDRAEEAERRRHESGTESLTAGGSARLVAQGLLRDQLLALLKAFTDAANKKGGLELDAQGRPADLAGLTQRGRDNAQAGNSRPKLLAKVRSGDVVDLKLAQAALHFFRWVLQQPSLTLDELGAVETQRLQALRQVHKALYQVREKLPVDILHGLSARAEEAAGYATAQDQARVHYSCFEPFVDSRGVHRLRVRRAFSYRPVRLSQYSGVVHPSLALEWYEWQRVQDSALCIALLDEQGNVLQELRPPLRKRLDEVLGVIMIEVLPQALAALQPLLQMPHAAKLGHTHEVRWESTMICNRADRDIIASYQPVNGLRISYTPSDDLPGLLLNVGDSPGLRRTSEGWVLDRALLPREVLAVRFRDSKLRAEDAYRLSPSGEWFDQWQVLTRDYKS